MGDTERMVGDRNQPRPLQRMGRSIIHLPRILFPSLPGPVQITAFILAVASIVAVALAWYGINSENGAGLAVFTAVMLTAFTVAAASLPRVAYSWLNRNRWFPGGEGIATVLAILGSHAPLFALSISNVSIAEAHHRTYVGMAAVGAIGAILWVGHDALKAKREYDLVRGSVEAE